MGGFLSAFYAILCFGYIEYSCVKPMFTRMGLPGGIKRYLDDVLVAALCATDSDKVLLVEFKKGIGGSAIYPAPLDLNVTDLGDQEFLEALVFGGPTLWKDQMIYW